MSVYSRVKLICSVCGSEYEQYNYRSKTSRFCSKDCWSQRNPPDMKHCGYCGKEFRSEDRRAQFCSRPCARKAEIGIKAHARKDGKSMERERAGRANELTVWRKQVYARDGYACQRCGGKGRIHAHHIKPWAEYPELRFDVSNGLTLCEDCHGKEHGKDFSNRRNKICPDCGKQTKGRGQYCSSCAIRHWHHSRRAPVT